MQRKKKIHRGFISEVFSKILFCFIFYYKTNNSFYFTAVFKNYHFNLKLNEYKMHSSF